MNYSDFLPPVFKPIANATNSIAKTMLNTLYSNINTLSSQAISYAACQAIKTSSGGDLDLWGIDFNLPRVTSESDSNYRTRLLEVYNGGGVTKPSILRIINAYIAILGTVAQASIYEWFDRGEYVNLKPFQFRLDLPLEADYGFVLDVSSLDFSRPTNEPHDLYEGFLGEGVTEFVYSRYYKVREYVNRFKAGGIKIVLSVANVIYSVLN